MALNLLGGESKQPVTAPVTLPKVLLPEIDDQTIAEEAAAAAARVAERRTVREGLNAWAAIGKSDCFEAWKVIVRALAVGKAHALRITGANAAWGSAYSRTFALQVLGDELLV